MYPELTICKLFQCSSVTISIEQEENHVEIPLKSNTSDWRDIETRFMAKYSKQAAC